MSIWSKLDFSERLRAVKEIRDSRERLGKFTLRDMMEAIYGEKFADTVLGKDGGNILMEELQMDYSIEEGGVKTKFREDQLEKIFGHVHPGLSKDELKEKVMSTDKNQAAADAIQEEINQMDPNDREIIMKFIRSVTEKTE